MTLLDSAYESVLAARPYVDEALSSPFAQTVTVTRFTGQSVQVRALIGQEEDGTTVAPDPDEPGFTSRSTTLVLAHTPLAQTPGFTVAAAGGRVFVPVAEPLNPGGLDWVTVVRGAPLIERTRVDQLSFQTAGPLVADARGNQRPGPGVPINVAVRLTATTDPRIRETVGADAAEVALIGRWGSLTAPTARPPGVVWGSSSPLTLDGQPGTLTVQLAFPDADLWREAQFGGRFLSLWRTR
ncbi:hypothetical protein [Deinococcus sp. QL22]|uniref:hypothetical protein n=1 Tax=Deinococcus sp. QL22 TaxID=2939437 RepID=UPI0020180C47|nr:hypothetical protein [Deinococcus sp. QL22]UQN10371.1 hypothetical protein M1R55_29915 [Deinococcus sp. QL22]UQN10505.1 hypothetical protein M1R55_29240 [Deinococcus sp. QL22]